MITDIQSAEFTEGKNSILYYVDDSIINEYLSLKKRVDELTAKNVYAGAERREISIRFGELLGYPEKIILSKVDGIDHSDPFVLY
jgi:CRISPR/Cas system type I-B associated protein Csh2 (Cas7 group RAMP superfamily)